MSQCESRILPNMPIAQGFNLQGKRPAAKRNFALEWANSAQKVSTRR
jgi:hypothetical protein